MSDRSIQFLEEIEHSAAPQVGGKALHLGLLLRSGLPVPPGFCITAAVYRQARHAHGTGALEIPAAIRQHILDAYRTLGEGAVAVRSSATCEDGAAASFAGLQETLLGIEGPQALLDGVRRCWQSLHTPRAVAYRRRHNIPDDAVAMSVVVQRLVPAEVSGVLFTHDPLDATGGCLLIEAARGLGESVVSGRVMPDRYRIDRRSGALVSREIHHQAVLLTPQGMREIDPAEQGQPVLDARDLAALLELARRVEAYYGQPRDIEWARSGGVYWLLQARPITTSRAIDPQQVRREEIQILKGRAAGEPTVWARYNLAEVLPAPTPLTWSIVRRFMSGRGGFGLMYRDMGFDPDPALDEEGIFDLICGRPYVNLNREPLLYFCDFPYAHDFQTLKADPRRALYPKPVADRRRITPRFWRRLPKIMFHMLRAQHRMGRMLAGEARRLAEEVFPRFAEAVADDRRQTVLSTLRDEELLQRLETWRQRTLVDFARHSLRPALLAALALEGLEQSLRPFAGPSAAQEAQVLVMGVRPTDEADLAGALRKLAEGRIDRDTFLQQFGHRGRQEMELAAPRWREAPESLPRPGQAAHAMAGAESADAESRWQQCCRQYNLSATAARRIDFQRQTARRYLALREAAKHYFMLGYAELRATLVELDRRYAMAGGIFYLEDTELPDLIAGREFLTTIAQRKVRRAAALSLEVPTVLFSDDLEALGRPAPIAAEAELPGTAVSVGVYEGPALVLEEPCPADSLSEGFVLVCPSTDPAWVPLFLKAGALVMETGGVLSHGAIVARECGIPAVAGIPGVHRRLHTGQPLRVDGAAGRVYVLKEPRQPSAP